MITLKVWNTLAPATRREICTICGIKITDDLLQPYHHNFDYDVSGKKLKYILGCCYLRPSDKKIIVSIEVSPKYEADKEHAKKPAKATSSMKKNKDIAKNSSGIRYASASTVKTCCCCGKPLTKMDTDYYDLSSYCARCALADGIITSLD